MNIKVNPNNIKLFECLSSITRIKVIGLLGKGRMSINELAEGLGVSSAIMSRHISLMEETGIVHTENLPGKRGLKKVCSLKANEITLLFNKDENLSEVHTVSIPVGHYSKYDIKPTCGLASKEAYIGVCDDPRYFSTPSRVDAALVWFKSGWIEYNIPSYIFLPKPIKTIYLSMEICSEFPHYNENWPSDIFFHINDVLLGVWQSPGDFGSKKGAYTPAWCNLGTQYGLLKNLSIDRKGTMIDGIKLSDTSIDKLNIKMGRDMTLRISSPQDASHPGGVNLFGRGFGNYDQNIEVRVEYE